MDKSETDDYSDISDIKNENSDSKTPIKNDEA